MRVDVQACDLGQSGGGFGACTLDTRAAPSKRPPLSARQRSARAIAGFGFLGLAAPFLQRRLTRPIGTIAAWFGATHLLAAATAFRGCPELGVVPSLLLRREVVTECGPWEWLDRRLGLQAAGEIS